MGSRFNLRRIPVTAGLFIAFCSAWGVEPLWKVDLRTLESQTKWHGDEVGIKFVGHYLIVYSGSAPMPGHAEMHPALILDRDTGRLLTNETLIEASLPQWDDCPRTRYREPAPVENIIDCRGDMRLVQVGGIGGPGEKVGATRIYLKQPGREDVLLFTENCFPGDPSFVGDDQILLSLCDSGGSGYRGVDRAGKKLYSIKLLFPYITVSRDGTRFAAYERYATFLHEISGTSNRARVKVFRSTDGEKLFEYGWHLAEDEFDNDGRIALSDDGSLIAIVQGNEILVFAVVAARHK